MSIANILQLDRTVENQFWMETEWLIWCWRNVSRQTEKTVRFWLMIQDELEQTQSWQQLDAMECT